MNVYQQLVNQKLKSVTEKDLIKYSKTYDIPITNLQAKQIAFVIRNTKNLNIFNDHERKKLLKEIARITNLNVARQLNKLFLTYTK